MPNAADQKPERSVVEAPPGLAGKPKVCPLCGKPATLADRPFCSRRCADVDLNRWLGGVYAVPAADTGQEDS